MDQCPKCGRWVLYYDPRSETIKCSNCEYEEYMKHKDFVEKKNVINDLFYPSKLKKFFYFCSTSGHYTGEMVLFLEEFAQKTKTIDITTLEYHFHRGDFEKWIVDVFENEELGNAINNLHREELKGETLRNSLYNLLISHL